MKISTRDRVLLAVAAALAILAGFYVFVLTPQRHQEAQLNRSIATAQQQLSSAQMAYAGGRAAQHTLRSTATEYAAAQRAVPVDSNVPNLLRLLQRAAGEAHVTISAVTMGASSPGSGASTSTTSTASATTAGSAAATPVTAQTVPVAFTFGGGYQALNRMVQQLDTFVRFSRGRLLVHGPLVGISSVTLSPGTGKSSALSVALNATIYQYAAASSVLGSTSGGTS